MRAGRLAGQAGLYFGFGPSWTVGWLEFNGPFQHKYGYITDGELSLPSEGRLAIY